MIDVLKKITEQRIARNWTEYQLAVHSGLPQSTISSWYRKNMLPTLSSLEKICNAFDMTISQFLAADNYTELTPQQQELLKKWELLTPQQKDALFDLICTIV